MIGAETVCPHCGRVNDLHDGPTRDATPGSGDVSICWRCRGLAIYTDGGVRAPTPVEAAELTADPRIRAAQGVLDEVYTPAQASALRWGTS